jgi:hypothetical protein
MKPDDVDKLEAGREMDVLVGREIFGIIRMSQADCYSTDIAAAWVVVEKLLAQDITLYLQCDEREYRAGERYWNGEWSIFADGETAPLAICRFALLVLTVAKS